MLDYPQINADAKNEICYVEKLSNGSEWDVKTERHYVQRHSKLSESDVQNHGVYPQMTQMDADVKTGCSSCLCAFVRDMIPQ